MRVENGRRLYDDAMKMVVQITNVMKDGDKVYFLPTSNADNDKNITVFQDVAALKKRVENVSPSPVVANISKTLQMSGQEVIRSKNI